MALARASDWLAARVRALPLFRAGTRDPRPLLIDNRRVYVLPTRFGLFFGLVLLAMTLGGLNFNNNVALLLVFVLVGLGNNALIAGHLSLQGMRIDIQMPEPVFAGQPLRLAISLQQTRNAEPQTYRVAFGDYSAEAMAGAQASRSLLEIASSRRGRFAIDRLTVSSLQPLALARAWCHVNLQDAVWVYPSPRGRPLQPQYHLADGSTGGHSRQLNDQPHHLRDYITGDPPKHIAWKASARTGNLQVRAYEQAQAGDLLLDWHGLPGLDYEARLSQLCLWLVQAEQKNLKYALHLPNRRIAAGQGPAHQRQCLEALAGMPHA